MFHCSHALLVGSERHWRTRTRHLELRLEERAAGRGRERVGVWERAPAACLRRRGLRLRRVARVGAASGPEQYARRQLRLRAAHTRHCQVACVLRQRSLESFIGAAATSGTGGSKQVQLRLVCNGS